MLSGTVVIVRHPSPSLTEKRNERLVTRSVIYGLPRPKAPKLAQRSGRPAHSEITFSILSLPRHRSAVGAVNVNNKDAEVVVTDEDRALEMAMTNVDIKRHLTLDLLLYEQAVDIHHVQAVKYGLIEE